MGTYVTQEDVIPCILHGEVRMAEKLVQQILLRGMLFNSVARRNDFIKTVEKNMNENILGKIDNHGRDIGRWKFPLAS